MLLKGFFLAVAWYFSPPFFSLSLSLRSSREKMSTLCWSFLNNNRILYLYWGAPFNLALFRECFGPLVRCVYSSNLKSAHLVRILPYSKKLYVVKSYIWSLEYNLNKNSYSIICSLSRDSIRKKKQRSSNLFIFLIENWILVICQHVNFIFKILYIY